METTTKKNYRKKKQNNESTNSTLNWVAATDTNKSNTNIGRLSNQVVGKAHKQKNYKHTHEQANQQTK